MNIFFLWMNLSQSPLCVVEVCYCDTTRRQRVQKISFVIARPEDVESSWSHLLWWTEQAIRKVTTSLDLSDNYSSLLWNSMTFLWIFYDISLLLSYLLVSSSSPYPPSHNQKAWIKCGERYLFFQNNLLSCSWPTRIKFTTNAKWCGFVAIFTTNQSIIPDYWNTD